MRWLIVQPGPSWSVQDVYAGWCEALEELGEHVIRWNLDDRLAFYEHALIDIGDPEPSGQLKLRKALTAEQATELAINGLAAALWKTNPDVLLLVCGFFVPPQLLDQARAYGTRVVIIHTEEPYEVERELKLAAHADLNLITDPTNLARFLDIAPTVYAPHAYRPTVHHPGPGTPALECDFAFVGTGFNSRRQFFTRMLEVGAFTGRDVLLGGNWVGMTDDHPLRPYIGSEDPEKCVDNTDTATIYRSAQVGINLYRREHDDGGHAAGWSMGPREVEMAACGMFFLRDPRPEGDEVFPMLPTFASPEEAAEHLDWWLTHPSTAATVAAAAHDAIVDRTFRNSAIQLLRLFDRQPVTTT